MSRHGNQKDHITEFHRIPTIEVHPTTTASKVKPQEVQNKQKESRKMGRQKKNMQSKGIEDSPIKELSEMELSKLSEIEFK